MKKILALLLSLMLVLSLAACGGDDTTDAAPDEEPAVTDEAETPAENEEVPEGRITDEQLADLTAAYNNVAVPYNEIATAVNENGWMNDEQTAAEMKALSDTLGFIGKGLTEDISLLDGSDFDALIDYLENEFPPALEELSERVSVPYEAG